MDSLNSEAIAHYAEGREHDRLSTPHGRLEFERSKDIISRHLFKPPAKILDLGGGTGHYSFWLANQGYEVHLVDAMESHIEAAKKVVQFFSLASITVGDARGTKFPDESFDVILLFGPLYHLTDKRDRITALEEARRLLKPSGRLLAVAISKFASLIDGYHLGFIDDESFQSIVDQDLIDGQHRNPENHPSYFTTTKFHDPTEFQREIEEAGFQDVTLQAVEGFAAQLPDLADRINSKGKQNLLFKHLRKVESEPSLLGTSPHFIASARKWNAPRNQNNSVLS
jgi:ubiquinone/menaquinone biosynthesis C-methylase UbiE